jgi:CheY-like chemotaxis protein
MDEFGRILMVEDDHNDVELILTALREYNLANEVVVTRDGADALDFLYGGGSASAPAATRPSCCSTSSFRK